MCTELTLLPSEEKVLTLLDMVASCEQYGYDVSCLNYLAVSGLLRTDYPSLFGLESFSADIADKETVLQSAMEQVAAAHAGHEARMENVDHAIGSEVSEIATKLDRAKDKKIPVSAIMAVLGAIVGAKKILDVVRAQGSTPKDMGDRSVMKNYFEQRKILKGKLDAAKLVKGTNGEILLPTQIAKIKAQLAEVNQSLQNYRHGSNSAAALWKAASGPKKAVIAAVAIAGNALIFWTLSKIVLAGLRWVNSKLGSGSAN